MTIEQHIEELRVELKNTFDASECRKIQAELECAQAELAIIVAEQEGRAEAEPPF